MRIVKWLGVSLALLLVLDVLLHAAASYPSSVKTFPTRTNGQTIAASWFNDVYDEVHAIEDGLLNGFAHALKPSSSTGQTLGTSALPWGTPFYMSMTSGGVLYGSAANTVASSGALTASDLVLGGGAGAAPTSFGTQTANCIVAGPASGSAAIVTCRAMSPLDLPRQVVTSQFDKTTNTTAAAITGLSFTLLAGKTYSFHLTLQVTADTTGGVKINMNGGTVTATSYVGSATIFSHATNPSVSRTTTLANDVISFANGVALEVVQVDGTIVVNAGGTFIPMFAQSASSGTSSVLIGSSMVVF